MESGNLSSLHNLTLSGLRGGVDMRPTLIRVLTDLYVQKLTHTPDEERHYTELALRLLDAVDVPTRIAVASRLSRHLSPPLGVIERLAADLPDVAAAVRAHPLLQARTKRNGAEAAGTIAEVVAALESDRKQTLPRAEAPHEEAAPVVVDAASPVVATEVASELNELFFAASADERRLILLNLEIVAPLPAGSADLARDAAVSRQLESAALARNRDDFAMHLAHALRIPRKQARRMAGDDLGEPIVVAAKALGIPRDVVYRMLLFVNPAIGHSVERVHALAMLHDELTVQAAEHMVVIWQALRKNERLAVPHQPLLWNDEARARARTASVTVRRASVVQRAGMRHDAS